MALGSPALVKERTRAVWVWTALEQLVQDIRIGFRILTKSPALSATAILLVALVIGGSATIFSMAHGILAKPSPGVHARGLMTSSWLAEDGFIETHTSHRVFTHFADQSKTLASIAAYDFQRLTLMHDNGSYAVRAGIVSLDYFDTLGVRIVNGRSFTADEAARGVSGLVAVISHHLWQNTFQGRDGIVGHADTREPPATVVGVAARPSSRNHLERMFSRILAPRLPARRSDAGTAVAVDQQPHRRVSAEAKRRRALQHFVADDADHRGRTQKHRVPAGPVYSVQP